MLVNIDLNKILKRPWNYLSSNLKVRKMSNYAITFFTCTSCLFSSAVTLIKKKKELCADILCVQPLCVGVVLMEDGVNPSFALLKQRYSTEASVQHGDLRDPPPGWLPEPVGGNGQQQLCPHQRWRQGLWQAEEKHPDVSSSKTFRDTVNKMYSSSGLFLFLLWFVFLIWNFWAKSCNESVYYQINWKRIIQMKVITHVLIFDNLYVIYRKWIWIILDSSSNDLFFSFKTPQIYI